MDAKEIRAALYFIVATICAGARQLAAAEIIYALLVVDYLVMTQVEEVEEREEEEKIRAQTEKAKETDDANT